MTGSGRRRFKCHRNRYESATLPGPRHRCGATRPGGGRAGRPSPLRRSPPGRGARRRGRAWPTGTTCVTCMRFSRCSSDPPPTADPPSARGTCKKSASGAQLRQEVTLQRAKPHVAPFSTRRTRSLSLSLQGGGKTGGDDTQRPPGTQCHHPWSRALPAAAGRSGAPGLRPWREHRRV